LEKLAAIVKAKKENSPEALLDFKFLNTLETDPPYTAAPEI